MELSVALGYAKVYLTIITHFLLLMIFSGTRLNAEKTDLSAILPEEVEEEVKAAAEISMGTEVLLRNNFLKMIT